MALIKTRQKSRFKGTNLSFSESIEFRCFKRNYILIRVESEFRYMTYTRVISVELGYEFNTYFKRKNIIPV